MTTTRSGFTKLAAVCIAILLGAVVWELGWPLTRAEHEWSRLIAAVATLGHLTGILGSYFRKEINRPSLRLLIFQIISCLMIFLLIAREQQEAGYMRFTELSRLVITAGLIAIPTLMSLTRIFEWLVGKQKKGRPLMAPAMQFVASLGVVILAGTGLLLLPNSTYPGITLSFTDALFTSTSAVCVTGLNAVDFAHTFTPLGEMFTLALIQIGGFGIMTFAYFVAMVAGQGFSLRDRVLLTDLLDEDNLGAVVSFITTIVVSTLFIELCGAVLLYFSWEGKDINLMGEPLWWHSLFHSVSAFCNAGFSTFPMNLMEPGIRLCYSGQAVIMALIVCGGLGFGIYKEINSRLANRFFSKHRRLHMQWTPYFKLVMISTGILLAGGALGFATLGKKEDAVFVIKSASLVCSYPGATPQQVEELVTEPIEREVQSMRRVHKITSESYYGRYLPAASLIMCGLMMVGGSPGGTAGGMRTTTCAIAGAEILRILRGRDHVEFFRRRIDQRTVARCVITVVVSCAWIGCFTVLICALEPSMSSLDIFFENCSAFATVGVSRGITPDLSGPSKYLLIVNMLSGRVGLFAFLIALAGTPTPRHYRYPSVKIPLT